MTSVDEAVEASITDEDLIGPADREALAPTAWWRRGRTWLRIATLALASLVWALLCDAVLEFSLRTESPFAMLVGPVLIGTMVLWSMMMALYALCGRLRVAFAVTLLVCMALAVVNVARIRVLIDPVVPADFVFLFQPGFLGDMVGWGTILKAVLASVALVLGLWWGIRKWGPSPQRPARGADGRNAWLGLRAVLLIWGALVMVMSAQFTQPASPLYAAYGKAGSVWLPWSQLQNYQANGFVGGALFNLPGDPMEEPPGYSAETMDELANRWVEKATVANAGTDPALMSKTNVVVVLSESMGDPEVIERLTFPEDPIPFIRSQMELGTGGHTLTHYGTGTSVMEFGALTGQTLALFRPQVKSPYQQFVADMDDYPSAVGWMKSTGHRTVAIHPYGTYMYRRPEVYRTFGFDEFVSEETISHKKYVGKNEYMSDESALEEVLQQMEASSDPLFAHVVSIQNHSPYESGIYPDPITPTGGSKARTEELGLWARGLRISDDAVKTFLAKVKATGEPTVVVYFGDHFPGLMDSELSGQEGMNIFKTPFFVWSNTGVSSPEPQGYVAPSAFLELATRKIGASVPPYLQLLRAVQEEVGVLRGDYVYTSDGRHVDMEDLTPAQKALVEDYRLVQYDFSEGKRYAQNKLWYGR